MKRNIKLTFLLVTIISSQTFSQILDKITSKATYKFTHKYDSLNSNLVLTENYFLLLGKKSSVFKSQDRFKQDSIIKSNYLRTGKLLPSGDLKYNANEIYFDFILNKMYSREKKLAGDYVMERSYPKIIWKIEQESKIINSLKCQKAVGYYHGRTYEAWFTKEIPISAGPWKLNGLPGLIIKATDKSGRIDFELTSFKNYNGIEKIAFDKKSVFVTWDEFKKLAKAADEDINNFVKAKFGATITTNLKQNKRNSLLPNAKVTFPMEYFNYYTEF